MLNAATQLSGFSTLIAPLITEAGMLPTAYHSLRQREQVTRMVVILVGNTAKTVRMVYILNKLIFNTICIKLTSFFTLHLA